MLDFLQVLSTEVLLDFLVGMLSSDLIKYNSPASIPRSFYLLNIVAMASVSLSQLAVPNISD